MKNFIKVTAIVGMICLIAGCGMAISAVALGADLSGTMIGYHDSSFSGFVHDYADRYFSEEIPQNAVLGEQTDENTYLFTGVKNLDLEINAGMIEIVVGEANDEITVQVGQGREEICYLEEETLKIKGKWGDIDLEKEEDRKIRITIPKNYRFDHVKLESVPGTITMEELITDDLEIEVKAGMIEISNAVVFDHLEVDCKVGSVDLEMTGKKTDYNYELDCRVGDIQIGRYEFSALSSDKTIYNDAKSDMELDCNAGSISVRFLEDKKGENHDGN